MAIKYVTPDGKELYYNAERGTYYPEHLNVTLTSVNNALAYRYAYCDNLKTAYFKYAGTIAANSKGTNLFNSCNNLYEITADFTTDGNTILAKSCPKLQTVTVGSIGRPITALKSDCFSNSGTSASGQKTITVYVADSTTIPLANAPWGFTGATVIYRSSTTGEIRTE